MITNIFAAFIIGLTSSVHCLFMCGGIASALQPATNSRTRAITMATLFNTGRIFSYALIGFILSALITSLDNMISIGVWLRVISGILLIAMGLYLSNIWRGLTKLESILAPLWQPIGNLARQLLPIRYHSHAFIVGALWGWLPCGLIYSTLIWASTATTALQSAILMLAMGVGTMPAMLGLSFINSLLKARWLKIFGASFLCIFGLWTLFIPISSLISPHSHSGHQHGQHAD